MRLIDTDAIKLPEGFFEKVDNVPKFYDWLDSLPAIEAEQVRHGIWKYKHFSSEPHCSLCLAEYPIETSYCPNCGAKLDGGGE